MKTALCGGFLLLITHGFCLIRRKTLNDRATINSQKFCILVGQN